MAVLKSWGCDPKPGYELMDKSKTGSYTLVDGLHELGQTDVGGGLEWPCGPGVGHVSGLDDLVVELLSMVGH
ncbi:hypothetical protein Tco_0056934 [Tanacetum coccineum]